MRVLAGVGLAALVLAGCEVHHYHHRGPSVPVAAVFATADAPRGYQRPAKPHRRAVRRRSRVVALVPLPAAWEAPAGCLASVRVVGPDAWTQRGAMIKAERLWRSTVKADHGERYMDLRLARGLSTSCSRSSTNESTVGKVGERVVGQLAVRDRCEITAVPCARGAP